MKHEIARLEALNEELTELYNKHMRSWADKYNKLEEDRDRAWLILTRAERYIALGLRPTTDILSEIAEYLAEATKGGE